MPISGTRTAAGSISTMTIGVGPERASGPASGAAVAAGPGLPGAGGTVRPAVAPKLWLVAAPAPPPVALPATNPLGTTFVDGCGGGAAALPAGTGAAPRVAIIESAPTPGCLPGVANQTAAVMTRTATAKPAAHAARGHPLPDSPPWRSIRARTEARIDGGASTRVMSRATASITRSIESGPCSRLPANPEFRTPNPEFRGASAISSPIPTNPQSLSASPTHFDTPTHSACSSVGVSTLPSAT